MSFLACEAAQRLKNNSLIHINSLMNWESLRYKMGNLGRSGYGPQAYDPLKMLKALVLQAWHSLSDTELEDALRVRLDFMIITGLSEVPDSTTICRFRTLLIKRNLMDTLLAEVNAQLEQRGLKVEASKGAILDATLLTSAARPKKEIEAILADREENESCYETEELVSLSQDPDATWLKKGKRSYFGYKGFVATDVEDGFITHVHVTAAHVSEVRELSNILPKLKVKGRLYGDKGYASQANKESLRRYGLKNGIMEKAKKNKPLTGIQRRFNRMISKIRYKVEQGFGTLKRRFKFERVSYLTKVKVHGQMVLKAVAFNLLKALNKFKKSLVTPPLRLC
jgi:transposase, IS5 family